MGGRAAKRKDVVIYCARGGSVSNSVLDELLNKGIRARFIEGGIEAFKKELQIGKKEEKHNE